MNSDSQSEQSETLKQENQQAQSSPKQSRRGLRKSVTKNKWQQRIYKNRDSSILDRANFYEFNLLSKAIFKRDHSVCQACFKTKRKLLIENKYLTAHHINPREDGGENLVTNLITLCNECHNKIEELKIKTKEEIYGYFTDEHKRWHRESHTGVNWTQWVYGGYHRPNK